MFLQTYNWHFDGKSKNLGILSSSLQADDKGCFSQVIKTKVFQLKQKGHDMNIEVEAKVKEEGTGLYYFKINVN